MNAIDYQLNQNSVMVDSLKMCAESVHKMECHFMIGGRV